ncbi:hypothetical protein NPIL_122551 [Nephila pilipes]|uniref:Uncharacterized protein n=1 Tax=Nephila pilipes TaxID=299642 RepID=A0A8X6P4G4_NEPPI|nr:hypothetical protein NPIL_122551 [Nephila pilipes]
MEDPEDAYAESMSQLIYKANEGGRRLEIKEACVFQEEENFKGTERILRPLPPGWVPYLGQSYSICSFPTALNIAFTRSASVPGVKALIHDSIAVGQFVPKE